MRGAGEPGSQRGEEARKQGRGREREAGERAGERPGGGRRGFPSSLLALSPGLRRRETCGERCAPLGPAGRGGSPLPRGAEPPLSLPPAAPRAGRLLGAHHHVHQLVAHVRRHRRRRGPPGAAAAAAAGGGGAQPPAGTRPAPPGAPRRGRPPGGLHQRPGAQGEPPAAGLPLSPGPPAGGTVPPACGALLPALRGTGGPGGMDGRAGGAASCLALGAWVKGTRCPACGQAFVECWVFSLPLPSRRWRVKCFVSDVGC